MEGRPRVIEDDWNYQRSPSPSWSNTSAQRLLQSRCYPQNRLRFGRNSGSVDFRVNRKFVTLLGQTSRAFVVLMPPTKIRKKRQLSGLSGLELQLAYNSLLKLKKTIIYEESEEDSEVDPNESVSESFDQQVDTMLSLLGSKLEEPQV